MGYLVINWVLGSVSLLITFGLLPGFRVSEVEAAVLVAGLVGLSSATIASAVRRIRGSLNAGLTWLLAFIADALIFRVTALIIPGFAMRGFAPAFAGAAVLVILSVALARIEDFWLHHGGSGSILNSRASYKAF